MAKKKSYGKYKNALEKYCGDSLKQRGHLFQYEPQYVLVGGFHYPSDHYKSVPKKSELVNVTGNQLSIGVGTAIATTNADALVSGSQVSLGAGTVTVTGTAVVNPTGSQVSLGIGTAVASADANVSVTGNSLTLATGSVTVTGTALVTPTGSQLTANTGEAGIITWNDIVPGVNMTWTPIDPY